MRLTNFVSASDGNSPTNRTGSDGASTAAVLVTRPTSYGTRFYFRPPMPPWQQVRLYDFLADPTMESAVDADVNA